MTVPVQRTAGPRPRVLLVEDDRDDARLITHRLQAGGACFDVRVVDDRQGFLDGLRDGPAVVLCDYALPSFGAPEALELMRRRGNDVPLIVVSGVLRDEVAVDLLGMGASDFLLKDRMGRLRSAVEAALAHAELTREVRTVVEGARRDRLTGLLNREGLEDLLVREHPVGSPYALCLIDLDGFKQVNDRHGHAVGDDVLRQVAQRLQQGVRRCDDVARLGGDEFVVVLGGVDDLVQAEAMLPRIRECCAGELDVGGTRLEVGASIGVAVAAAGEVHHEVLRRADVGMYSAKRASCEQRLGAC